MADTVTPSGLSGIHGVDTGSPPPVHGWGRLQWWLIALAAGVVAVGAGLAVKSASPPTDAKSADMITEKDAIGVRQGAPQWRFLKLGTVGAVGAHWTDSVPARITIDESLSSKVGVPVDGRITRVMVQLGETVGVNQPLFALASPAVEELRTAQEQAQVELDAARTALDRIEASVASRALPAKEAQAARQRVRTAELALQLAAAKLSSVRAAPGSGLELVVTAPRAGVVVDKNVVVSQQVQPDAPPLMVVADLSSVWAIVDVFESQSLDIRPGGTAEVVSPSLPGITLTGRVLMVPSVGDPERHTLPVRVQLANPDRRLRPNVYARVRFSVQRPEAALEVPATAIVSDGEREYVYLQDKPGHFVRREVVAGSAHEGRMPIIKGLALGDTIVEEGGILLDNQISISQ
jgi:cobalt-zinc-cadmium efflux system membrane fusion protein